MAALDKYGYRAYLKEKGFADDDITYDTKTNSVMAKGKFFANATPESDGSTYDTRNNLEIMYRAYQAQNGPQQKYSAYQDKTNTLLNNAEQRLAKPAQPYQPMTAQSLMSNPAYQTALQAAQQSAATQQGNTYAQMRAQGRGKSSYSDAVTQQIGQQAMVDLNARLTPEIMAQNYREYIDQQNLERQNLADSMQLAGVYSNLYQQGADNDFREREFADSTQFRDKQFGEQQKQNNWSAYLDSVNMTGNMGTGAKSDYSLLGGTDGPRTLQGQQFDAQQQQLADEKAYRQQRDSEEDRRWWSQYEREGAQFAARQGLEWAQMSQRDKEFTADQAWKEKNFNADQEQRKFERDLAQNKRVSYKDNPDYAQDLQYVYSNPAGAVKEIQDNAEALIGAYGTDGYNALLAEARRFKNESEK